MKRIQRGQKGEQMGNRKKERAVVAGLWFLLFVVVWYVYGILFPESCRRAERRAVSCVQELTQDAISALMLRSSPLVTYVLEEQKGEQRMQATAGELAMAEAGERLAKAAQQGSVGAGENAETVENAETEGNAEAVNAETAAYAEAANAGTEAGANAEPAAAAAVPISRLEQFREKTAALGFSFEQMMDYQFLLNQLYVVSAGTSVTAEQLDPQTLLSKSLAIEKTGEYQILIYHTHSQEAYADSVPGDVSQTVVGMGELLAECLRGYGYSVMHHRGIYDVTDGVLDRDPAYTKAMPVISSILEAHPEIQVVIDLHRDGVREDLHLVQEIDGKQTARIMYFNGMCRSETGEIEGLVNPYREDNMAFSLQMALTTMADYPGLTRCIYVRSNRYNLHMRARSALIEVGAQTNTVEEVKHAIPIVADVLNQVLSIEQK